MNVFPTLSESDGQASLGTTSLGGKSWGDSEPVRFMRTRTFDPISLPGAGKEEVYRIAKGEIPEALRPLLVQPFSETERQRLFHRVDALSAERIAGPCRPKALWVFGPPAVGKTTMAEEVAYRLFGRANNAVVVDGDDIRQAHEGFQRVAQNGVVNKVVHADAWQIFKDTKFIDDLKKEIFQTAVKNRQHIQIPETALKTARVRKSLAELEAAGYEMHAICLWAPEFETQVRGRARSVKAGKVFSTQFYAAASAGCLEFGQHWENQIREGSPHYGSVTYYDNTVKPGQPVHRAQFEILSKMSRREAIHHATLCKASKEAADTAHVAASEASARGGLDVGRIWLQSARKVLARHASDLDSPDECASVDNVDAGADVANRPLSRSLLADVDSFVRDERRTGRLEGLILGVGIALLLNAFFHVSSLRRGGATSAWGRR